MKPIETIIWWLTRRAFRQRFFSVQMRNAEVLRGLKGPAIIYANHSGWWDTFLCFLIKRHFGLKAYGMMEEKHLKTASFLKHIGVFGIDLESPRGAVGGLREAVRILDEEGIVYVFPQGRHTPFHVRPVEFKPGLEWIVRKKPETQLIAMAVRYVMLWESRPQIFVSVRRVDAQAGTDVWRKALEEEMDGIVDAVTQRETQGFDMILPPSLSINKRWSRFKAFWTGRSVDPYNT